MITYSDEYAGVLKSAIGRGAARAYAMSRLDESLAEIGLERSCASDVEGLILSVFNGGELSGEGLGELVSGFRQKWGAHLDRAYLSGYEGTRWGFIRDNVIARMPARPGGLGRCLDLGCGRGCVTAEIAATGQPRFVVGVDGADFEGDWRERRSGASGIRFSKVAPSGLADWLAEMQAFDSVFLFYVLHHSEPYWAARTLRTIHRHIDRDGLVVVLEDSLLIEDEPTSDPKGLSHQWRSWALDEREYLASVGFDVQVILDFVAVQLLAGFLTVGMPCNYRTGSEWQRFFESCGFAVSERVNLGFPANRDIDVPQALFFLRAG